MTAPTAPDFPAGLARRLRVSEIFDGATSLFRAHWLTLLVVAAVVTLPLTALGWFATKDLDRESLSGGFLASVIGAGLGLLGALATLAFTLVAAEALEGRTPTPAPILRRALALWPACILTALLGGVIITLLLFCFIVPGVIWSVYYTFLLPAVALRDLSGKTALDYSKGLVVGGWWRTLGIVLVTSIPAITIGVILSLPLAFAPENLVVRLGIGLVSGLASAFQSLGLVIFFLNEEAARGSEEPWLRRKMSPVGSVAIDPGPIYPP